MRKLVILLLTALLLLNTGCALTDMGIFAAPKMEKDKLTVIDKTKSEENTVWSNLDAAISAYLEEEIAFKSIGGTAFEVHELYGTEEKNGETKAYIWSRMQEFALSSGKLVEGSGYSMPLVIELKKKQDGDFEVVGHEAPKDGDQYISSVKSMFPAEYQDAILARSNVKELDRILRQKAMNYFNLSNDQLTGDESNEFLEETETEKDDVEEVRDGEPQTDSGTYVGLIDSNSIEILISGVPLEKAARAFRLSQPLKEGFEDLDLKEGEQVIFDYYVNGYDQFVLTKIKKLTN